ncbi:calponin domain-containing protein [Polychytrium aggregatum]|uniref:calponin domain-containing protein n=1 Tax=Polychytrium aggregatum TaxID=110093 RepID=UPI0022FE3013|nr:calponin domain-containing protein [Polychytrium aggregatum]KAI9206278.1 calponin homology domain-containing protein [Polychytrium aggregatum]
MVSINAQALAARFPHFSASEISAFHQQFSNFDKDGQGAIHQRDLSTVATKTGESFQAVCDKLANLKLTTAEGLVSFEGLLTAVSSLRDARGVGAAHENKTKITLHGHSENTTHTINEDEKESFVNHINSQLSGDKDLKSRLPFDPKTMQIFGECKDGLVLAKLINDAVPNTIDERVLNLGGTKKLSTFQMTENNNLVVNSAKAIGCSVVNIGASDLQEGREHLILGLIWQIIKIGLSNMIDIKIHPELFRLLEEGESMEDFLKLPAEQILLRWVNYHLKNAGWPKRVKNFGNDVKDAEAYTVLLNQLSPELCSRAPLQQSDLLERAEMVLANADKLGCRKYLTPKTLVGGNQKLNFAFTAYLFNTHPGLAPLTDAEMGALDEWLFGSEGDREARAFALWLNSLGVEPFVNNLFDDLQDGLILLQAIDKVQPGIVDWKKTNRTPYPVTSKFKKVENTNYVVVLGKALKFSLVGIQGSDITDGNKKLTLGFVWQLMRQHVVETLKSLSKDGKDITDADMINWANATVKRSGKSSSMSQFKDPELRNGIFFLDLLNAIKKGIVNYDLVTRGVTDDEAKLNAKYAISIARKLGATIFVLPEDIVEVKPKMILTFVGTLMALDRAGVHQ